MSTMRLLFIVTILFSTLSLSAEPTAGPLHVSKDNPRYFEDANGNIVYLTGSHVWYNLVDMGPTDPPPKFDYEKYLDWMIAHHHNFMRMWTWEFSYWDTKRNGKNSNEHTYHYVSPLPWQRTGPGNALDGKPKFDIAKYNPDYFHRLRTRVEMAGQRGIYVSVMLFEGWGMQFIEDGFKHHPFHPDNNINGVNGDADGDGKGLEVHELVIDRITKIQEAYVKKVIDTVNDLDNVLYEISNENHPPSTEWEYHMIRFIHDYEKSKPEQHPVWMTFQYKGGSNQTLFDSPAEVISPNHEGGYRDDPPVNDGKKVILNDTDHLWGIGGNSAWVWKSFMRGYNPIFMDPYDAVVLGQEPLDPKWEPVRKALGDTRRFADRIDLKNMVPSREIASSGYCLANPGKEYLTYLPDGGDVVVDLTKAKGEMKVEWFQPKNEETKVVDAVSGGSKKTFKSPFEKGSDAVLYLHR